MCVVIPAGSLSDAAVPEFRNKGRAVLDLASFFDPRTGNRLRRGHPSGSAYSDGATAGIAAAAKRAQLPAVGEAFDRCGVDDKRLFPDQFFTSELVLVEVSTGEKMGQKRDGSGEVTAERLRGSTDRHLPKHYYYRGCAPCESQSA